MRLPNGTEWLLHCCVTLSQATEPVSAQALAELHDVPPAYLAKQLQALARAGIARSRQGQVGGYTLTRPAAEISVLDVVTAADDHAGFFRCAEIRCRGPLAIPPERCTRPCAIARVMAVAEQAWRDQLGTVSIADLAASIDADSNGVALANMRGWLRTR